MAISLSYGLSKGILSKIYGVSSLDSIAYYLQNTMEGIFIPSNSNTYHYISFSSIDEIINSHGVFKTGTLEEMIQNFKKSKIIAGPDKKVCEKFALLKKYTVEIFPKASLNGLLAKERIIKNIPSTINPYYV